MAAAAAAFKDSALPAMGMVKQLFERFLAASVAPFASFPIITAQPAEKSIPPMLLSGFDTTEQ